MNFARTNLSLLLARQCSHTARRAPAVDLRQRELPARRAATTAPAAAVSAAADATSRIELIGGGATMLLFLVLALFG